MDKITSAKRSEVMSHIKGKNTKPEMLIRRLIHSLGYRYRLHVKSLPGIPDLVFPSRRKVIFIHGCFWHRHSCLKGRSMPSTNKDFWKNKFIANKRRDKQHQNEFRKLKWGVLTIWECQTKNLSKIKRKIIKFLENNV